MAEIVEKKTKMGRPTIYRPEMCQKVIELGKTGASMTKIAVELGIAKPTLYEWAETNKEFSNAIKLAQMESQRWWEDQAQNNLTGEAKINAAVWIFNMKNRFREDWADKQEVEHSGSIAVPVFNMNASVPQIAQQSQIQDAEYEIVEEATDD